MGDIRLRTPQQVSDDFDGNIKVATIKRLCREGVIEYMAADRGKVLLDDSQVEAMLERLRKPAKPQVPRAGESPFGSTARSKSSRRKAGN